VAGTIGDIAVAEPAFMVERFEPDGERLEVTGHWRGLRGRRFVRPVLWLYRGEDRQRLVAVLDHKPWAAGEGDQWIAAFPWRGGKLDAERAELEVGRELVVELPVPGGKPLAEPQPAHARRPTELEMVREQLAEETRERRMLQDALDARVREAEKLARLRTERDAAREEAEQARADGERLVNDEYRQRERALAAAEEAAARARDAEAARDLTERQLNAARASHAELEQRLAEAQDAHPDHALQRRLAAAEAALADHEALVERLNRAEQAHAHVASLKKRLAEAERANAGRRAAAEKDGADRERLVAELTALRSELAAANEDRDRLRAELAVAPEPAPAPAEPVGDERADAELAAARADRDRLERELTGAAGERDRLERELAAAWAERDRLEAEVIAARGGRERVESELVAVRGERKRLERELAEADRAPRPLARASRVHAEESRLAPPREGTALWVVRAVALAMVVLLLVAVALVLGRVL
jgi:hypothetical protein